MKLDELRKLCEEAMESQAAWEQLNYEAHTYLPLLIAVAEAAKDGHFIHMSMYAMERCPLCSALSALEEK